MQINWGIGSTRAAGSRLSGTCPREWTSTLSEVPNEKADRSPDGRRIRRHDSRGRSADARHAGGARAIRDSGGARESGEQEGRQVGRQEKGQSQRQEGRIQELKAAPAPTGRAGPERRDLPRFCFWGTTPQLRGRDTIAGLMPSAHP
ncbi:MAG: hypothetical protein E6H51_01370 [Betaproteobacteria bacterium]|nr:MAG: hypothetical protein E6H51_01370 [Betaproteobacteria bacterium]